MKSNRREWIKATGAAAVGAAFQRPGPTRLRMDPDPPTPPVEPPPPPPPPPGTLAMLTPKDMTLQGQAGAPNSNYANATLALRYVGEERRFLTYEYGPLDAVGDLVEYRLPALKNGASHWTLANVPAWIEVRRWKNWSTRDRMVSSKKYGAVFKGNGGNGVWPASFYWDEAQGLMWYTWQPQYPGGPIIWPAYSAVRLVDGEAGKDVSPANILGPFFFRSNNLGDDFKDATAGIIPIPANRHAAMKGKYLMAGHHAANNGTKGPHGIGLWVSGDIPSPPAQDAVLWPNAYHLYDTSSEAGVEVPHMKAPNISYQACNHASQGGIFHKSIGGVVSQMAPGEPVGLSVGDCLYQHDYGGQDTMMVYMDAPAAGGSWVPELYLNGAWFQPPGWKMAAGNPELGGAENVFYWQKVNHQEIPVGNGLPGGWYIRLRRTVAGTNGGKISSVITTTSTSDADPYPYRPEGMGGHAPLGKEQYDATHYSNMYEENAWGGAWVQTANVEGLAYFGPLRVGGQWYGASPAWMQPKNGGVPVRLEQATAAGPEYGNGGRSEGPQYPFFYTFSSQHLMECAAGTRARNTTGLNPTAYYRLYDEYPGLIKALTAINPRSPYFGQPTFSVYGTGHSVVFDPKTSELFVLLTNGAVWSPLNILACWKVR